MNDTKAFWFLDEEGDEPRENVLFCWMVAIVAVMSLFLVQSHVGVNLADEGYLWYGVWRVHEGEIPRVDFRSYDPIRVYWVAGWSLLFGSGPIGIRLSVALVQILGLAAGLLVLRRVVRSRVVLVLIAIVFLLWMYPRHKYFEPAIAMGAVLVAVNLLQCPDRRRTFLTGAAAGLFAMIRRSHALYAGVPLGLLSVACGWRRGGFRGSVATSAWFAAGWMVGFAPMWVLALSVPGFGRAYLDSISILFERGVTNQALPIPWPWVATAQGQGWLDFASRQALGWGFVLTIVTVIVGIVVSIGRWRTQDRDYGVLLASTCVACGYIHYALVRSDLGHLGHAIHPVLIAVVALVATFRGRGQRPLAAVVSIVIVLVTLFGPARAQPGVRRWFNQDRFYERNVRGDRLWVTKRNALLIDIANRLASSSDRESGVFFAPDLTMLYYSSGVPAPVWDPYPLWPVGVEDQRAMIADLERLKVDFALIRIGPFAGITFREGYPLVWSYIKNEFQIREIEMPLARVYRLYERRRSQPETPRFGRGGNTDHSTPTSTTRTIGIRPTTEAISDGS